MGKPLLALVLPVLCVGLAAISVADAAIDPVTVDNNSGGGMSYRNAIATTGSTLAAVNLGHAGANIVANGVTFVSTPGANPSGPGWSLVGPAVDDGLGNPGLDDLFFSEVWGSNPVRLDFSALNPARTYLVQILHGEPRNCCAGTFFANTFSNPVDGTVPVPTFQLGNNINAENPPAANDVAVVTTRMSGVTSFSYAVWGGPTRGASMAGFQVRDLGVLLPTLTPADGASGVGLLPALSWAGPPGASYEVFFDFGFGMESLGSTGLTTVTVPGGFEAATTYSWRIDVTLDGETYPGDPTSFTTRGAFEVTTELDEDDGALGIGAGNSLRELIIHGPAGGNLIRFSPALDGKRMLLANGELSNNGEWLHVDGSTLPSGITIDAQGGSRVFLTDGTVILDTLSITGGNADDGGAIRHGNGMLEIRNSTVSGSTAARGGAIHHAGQSLRLLQCTIAGNTATQSGGGLHAVSGTVLLAHATVSGNSSVTGGGIFIAAASSLGLENTIVAGNNAAAAPDIFAAQTLTLAGVNLVGRSSGNPASGPAVITGVDAGLGALGDYGGPTPTMLLLAGSPAIDAGLSGPDAPPTDQRGNPRILAAALDIGAFESGVSGLSPEGGRLHALPEVPPANPGRFEISLDPDFRPGVKAVSKLLAGSGIQGGADGSASTAAFYFPSGLAVDGGGNLYVADTGNHAIRRISANGTVKTLAGGLDYGFANGAGSAAMFAFPEGIAIGPGGVLYVCDTLNHAIRKLVRPARPDGDWSVTTLAGAGSPGFRDSFGGAALFRYPSGLAVDASGNVFVADTGNHRVRKISPNGMVMTVAGSGTAGWLDGLGGNAQFRDPADVAVDALGNVYVADRGNHAIRRITPAGNVTTLAGSPSAGLMDGGGLSARFDGPAGITFSDGRLLVTDQNNHVLRMVFETSFGSGIWEVASFSGDGIDQPMEFPGGVTSDALGRIYVADTANHQIRRIGRMFIAVDARVDAASGELVADPDVATEGLDAGQRYYFRWVSDSGIPDSAVQVLPLPSPLNLDDFEDWDSDEIINLLEEAYGLDAFFSSQDGLPTFDRAAGITRMTYRRSLTATGISMTPEWSPDLRNWTPVGITEAVLSSDGLVEYVLATIATPPGGRIFMRLQISRNSP